MFKDTLRANREAASAVGSIWKAVPALPLKKRREAVRAEEALLPAPQAPSAACEQQIVESIQYYTNRTSSWPTDAPAFFVPLYAEDYDAFSIQNEVEARRYRSRYFA